jgi:rifampicin phosphotransferase
VGGGSDERRHVQVKLEADRAPYAEPLVSRLHGPSPADDAAIGGKAANLRRLARAGCPVPPGFCLTADAHRRHLEQTALAPSHSDLADAMRSHPLPTAVELALASAVATLVGTEADVLLAVRSSAVGEDGNAASFAGQYVSVLGVRADAVGDAVRACWASLYSATAVEYRSRLEALPFELGMPVLVQRLVPAEVAAVAFSADPVDGCDDRIVLNVARGLGPPLVSGAISADTIEFDKATLEPRVVEKGSAGVWMGVRDGAVVTADPPAARDGMAVSLDVAAQLAELCLDACAVLGFAVDLEAAYAAGRWWVVQARPITAL